MSLGLLRRPPLKWVAMGVGWLFWSNRSTARAPWVQPRRRPSRSRVRPLVEPLKARKVVSSGPSGSWRQRQMRSFGMSLNSRWSPRQTGPSVKPRPPAMRSRLAPGSTSSVRRPDTSSSSTSKCGIGSATARAPGGEEVIGTDIARFALRRSAFGVSGAVRVAAYLARAHDEDGLGAGG